MIDPGGAFVIVAGHAVEDPSVAISFDEAGDGPRFDVTVDDQTMFASGDAVSATVEGSTVRGTAMLEGGAQATEATFELSCA